MPRSRGNPDSAPADRPGDRSDGGAAGGAGDVAFARMDVRDVPDVAQLEEEIFPDAWSGDSFLAEVERKPDIGYPIVVRSGDELVAYAVVWFIVDEIHIGNIAVRPEHQGRGIGTALMTHILDEGRRRSLTYATLEVRPSNARALALYERFGFKRVAVRRNYYRDNREDAQVLALSLGDNGEDPDG